MIMSKEILLVFMLAYITVLNFLWDNAVHSKNKRDIEKEG